MIETNIITTENFDKLFGDAQSVRKSTPAQRAKVERCVVALKARTGRKKPTSKDFKICWASVKGTTNRKKRS